MRSAECGNEFAEESLSQASQLNGQPIRPKADGQLGVRFAACPGEYAISINIFKYSLRSLSIGVTITAMLCKVPDLWHGIYYHERIKITELIKRTPAVRSAEYVCDAELTESILLTTIELRDRPDATLKLCRLEDHENGVFRHLHVRQIGDLIPLVGHWRDSDRPNEKIGEPVRRYSWRPDADIGPDSELKDILPFTVSTLDELIEHYDEILAYFETCQTSGNRGTIRLPDGSELDYHVHKQP